MTFWLNGDYQTDRMTIDIADRGFLLGDGVFETLLVEAGVPTFLGEHLDRLQYGLAALSIDAAIPDNISNIIAGLAEKNGLGGEKAAARITFTRGPSDRGVLFPGSHDGASTRLITLARAPAKTTEEPLSLVMSQYVRCEKSVTSRHKTTNYLDNILARNEAKTMGAEEAVMVNSRGRVACASSANIFVIKEGGDVVTPPCDEGALNGIVRRLLLDCAVETGVNLSEAPLGLELLQQGEPFLTNSLIGLRRARLKSGGRAPAALQVEIFNQLEAWYQGRLDRSLTESAPCL